MAQIVIYNDNNTILIDDEYVNNTLVSKHTLYLSSSMVGYGMYCDFTIEYSSDYGIYPPVVALHKEDGFIAIGSISNARLSNGAWSRTYRFVGSTDNSQKFELFIFGIPQQSGGAGEGLVVLYNAEGTITFDSGLSYVRVVDFVDYRGMDSYGSGSLVKTYSQGRKYAVIYSQFNLRYNSSGSPGGVGDVMATACICRGDGILIAAHWMKFSTASTKYAPYSENSGLKVMVIDVTGM